MPNPTCFATTQICGARIALLEESGSPDTGADNGYVTNATISAAIAVTLEDGLDLTQKNGCDAICATLVTPDKIKAAEVTLQLCQLDFQLMSLLLGWDTFSSSGNVVGFQVGSINDSPPALSLEIWTKAWDGAQQAVPAFTSPDAAYVHFVFPFTRWTLGDSEITGEDFTIWEVVGTATENSRITTNGPFDDWPLAVSSAGGVTRTFGAFFDPDLPASACDFIPVTSAAS